MNPIPTTNQRSIHTSQNSLSPFIFIPQYDRRLYLADKRTASATIRIKIVETLASSSTGGLST